MKAGNFLFEVVYCGWEKTKKNGGISNVGIPAPEDCGREGMPTITSDSDYNG